VSDGGFAIAWTAPGRRVDVLAIEHRSDIYGPRQ
jgi:hypothetical protein